MLTLLQRMLPGILLGTALGLLAGLLYSYLTHKPIRWETYAALLTVTLIFTSPLWVHRLRQRWRRTSSWVQLRHERTAVTLRALGIVFLLPVLFWTTLLLIRGGAAMVQQATSGGAPAPPQIVYEPVPIAIVPLLVALVALVGFIRNSPLLMWVGGLGLILIGVLTLFSIGIPIALAGLAVIVLTLLLQWLNRSRREERPA